MVFASLSALTLGASGPADAARPFAVSGQHALAEPDLIALLTSTLQQDYVKDKGELELHVTEPWTSRNVPNKPLTINIIEMPTLGVTPSFIVRFELLSGGESLGSWQLPVQAHVWREVWVARSVLQRGDSIAGADIARARRDMLTIHEPLADFSSGDPALELAEPVAAGAPLLARYIVLRPVIHRGQTVNALVEDGALSVVMKVEALEDGAPGQIVRARNPQSLRDIRGKVLNDQTLLVSL